MSKIVTSRPIKAPDVSTTICRSQRLNVFVDWLQCKTMSSKRGHSNKRVTNSGTIRVSVVNNKTSESTPDTMNIRWMTVILKQSKV